MNWKFWEREERQQPYSDAIVAAIAGGATGGGADAKTAIREACAALWARAFASGTVSPANPATAALNPKVLALIGRELYSTGEVVFDIRVAGGRVALQSAASWSIVGLDTWSYELNMPQPSGHLTRFRPAAGVVHLRYADPPGRPWEGVSPAANASATHSLAGAVEKRLAQELDMPVGAVLPVPDTEAAGGLQSDISALEGKTVLVPSTAGGWDQQTGSSALASDWQPRRLGANPPATLEEIRRGAGADIAAAAGVPAPCSPLTRTEQAGERGGANSCMARFSPSPTLFRRNWPTSWTLPICPSTSTSCSQAICPGGRALFNQWWAAASTLRRRRRWRG